MDGMGCNELRVKNEERMIYRRGNPARLRRGLVPTMSGRIMRDYIIKPLAVRQLRKTKE